jgi:hypothetical protein
MTEPFNVNRCNRLMVTNRLRTTKLLTAIAMVMVVIGYLVWSLVQ